MFKQIFVAIIQIISGPCRQPLTHLCAPPKEASLAALPAAKPAPQISANANCGEESEDASKKCRIPIFAIMPIIGEK